jgi:hypothetical protein
MRITIPQEDSVGNPRNQPYSLAVHCPGYVFGVIVYREK